MNIEELQAHWNEFGKTDPLYAILTAKDKEENRWSPEEFFAIGSTEVRELMTSIESLGLQVPSGKALDFGCGVGRLTQSLACCFDQVCGVDIAPSMIELANGFNRYQGKCHYYVNAADDLKSFGTNEFDFIYSNITLQHIAPEFSQRYIREFIRLLAPGGLLVFQLPEAPAMTPRRSLRTGIKSLIPRALISQYRNLRYGDLKPVMQMYGVSKTRIVGLLAECEAEVLHIERQSMAAEGWVSYVYFVRRGSLD